MLTDLEFQSLTFSQQDEYVRAHGHYQAQRWHENYSVELYELNGFYCELWLEQECLQPPRYHAFTTTVCLEMCAVQKELMY